MSGEWDWWTGALQGTFGNAHKLDPQPGYYRVMDDQTGELRPAAIWLDDDGVTLLALVGEDDANPFKIWPAAWPNPITYEVYEAVTAGGDWPAQSNGDAFTVLSETIAETIREAEKLAPADLVVDIEARNRLSDIASKLVELRDEAERMRTAEGAPQKATLRQIDEKWKPVITSAKDRAAELKRAIGAALSIVKSRAAALGIEAKTKSGTGARRAVSLRTRKEVKCTDFAALLAHYVNDDRFHKDPGVCRALLGIAKEDLEAGATVPGAILEILETAA